MHSIITELRRLIVKREKHTQTEGGGETESQRQRDTHAENMSITLKKFF